MKRNALPLSLLTVALVLAFGLLFTGCGLNRADEGSALETEAVTTVEQTLDERVSDLRAKQARLAEIADELADRETEIAAQIARQAAQTALAEAEAAAAAEAEAARVVVTLPTLTALEIDLLNDLSSESSLAGDAVIATLAQDVLVDGLIAIPAGSELRGVVTEAIPARKFGGQAKLELVFDRLVDDDGTETPLAALVEITGERQKKKDTATIAGSAAGGAVLGRILADNDRDEGTAVGAVLGGAIGAVVAARNKNDPVELFAGDALVAMLDTPLTLTIEAGA